MAKGTIGVEVKCLHCRSAIVELPDGATDDSRVHCTNCGKDIGSFGAIKAAFNGEASDAAIGISIEPTFKPLP